MNEHLPNSPRLLAKGLRFPEGPAFAPDGTLWSVELKGGGLARWHEGELTRVPTGGAPNGAAVDAAGRVWFCDAAQNAIRRLNPRTGAIETLADRVNGQPLNKPNDLAFDRDGNLIFTCPGDSRQEPTGYICCLSLEGAVSVIARDLYFPNGLAFTADGSELVVAETYRQRLWRGAWDAVRREWRERRVWATGLNGAPGPDGMAFADDGTLFVAVYGAGAVMRVDTRGHVCERFPTSGHNPTNSAFDPSGVLGLVVTEAERGELLSLAVAGRGVALFRGKP
jgi:gluconolactonase